MSATQLGVAYSRADARRIVAEWCRFFSRPSPILELHFTSRTPKRLFEALAGQSQLRRLRVKWGDYDELDALASMVNLTDLTLGGASSVRSLDPLARLRRLDRLHIESLRYVRDLNSDKRCAMLSRSSQVRPHRRWSRPGVKISTDLMVDAEWWSAQSP